MSRVMIQTGRYDVLLRVGAVLVLPDHFGHVVEEQVVINPNTGEVDETKVIVSIDEVRSEAIEQHLDQHDGVLEYWQVAPVRYEDED